MHKYTAKQSNCKNSKLVTKNNITNILSNKYCQAKKIIVNNDDTLLAFNYLPLPDFPHSR